MKSSAFTSTILIDSFPLCFLPCILRNWKQKEGCKKMSIYINMTVLQLQNDYVHNCVIFMPFKEPISKIFNYTCRSRKFTQEGGPRNFFACQESQMYIFGNDTICLNLPGVFNPSPQTACYLFFHFNYILFQIKGI